MREIFKKIRIYYTAIIVLIIIAIIIIVIIIAQNLRNTIIVYIYIFSFCILDEMYILIKYPKYELF